MQKLLSRKFWLAVLAVVSTLAGLDLEPHQHAVVGIVAVVYLLVEGAIDRKRAEGVVDAVQRGLELGREVSTKGASE